MAPHVVQTWLAQLPLQHSPNAWQLEPPGLQLPPVLVLVVSDPVLVVSDPVLVVSDPVLSDPVVMLEPTLAMTWPPPLGSAPPEPVVEPSGLATDEPQAAPKMPRRARRTGNQAKCFMNTSAWDAMCRSTTTLLRRIEYGRSGGERRNK